MVVCLCIQSAQYLPELHIRGGFENNSKIISSAVFKENIKVLS